MDKFLDEEIQSFEILDEDVGEKNAERQNSRRRSWVGTWNNPSMSDEEFKEYFEKQCYDEVVQYAVFQREKGEETGTIHFQFFVNFKTPQYFKKIKEKLLPYGCHFKPMISTATRCRDYCTKVDTRVSGPYEIGEFEEERQRSDLLRAIKMIDEGVPYNIVSKIFPSQCLMYEHQLKSREADNLRENFSEQCRNVETTYIYGKGGVGKTSSIYKRHGFSDVFFVSSYEKYLFENYGRKKVIVFDEFNGQIKLPIMNRYLDVYPLDLRGLGKTYPACYDKVYILSNLPLKDLYKNLEDEDKKSLEPFYRRIHNIIYVDENGIEHKEKETIFRDLKPEEVKLKGLTRTIDKIIYYDHSGKITKIIDSQRFVQSELVEIKQDGNLPW